MQIWHSPKRFQLRRISRRNRQTTRSLLYYTRLLSIHLICNILVTPGPSSPALHTTTEDSGCCPRTLLLGTMGRTRRESAGSEKDREGRRKMTNHYAVMGIHDFARGSESKRAYHRLALEWHPDRQVHASEQRQKEAEDVFKARQ